MLYDARQLIVLPRCMKKLDAILFLKCEDLFHYTAAIITVRHFLTRQNLSKKPENISKSKSY